MTTAEIGTGGGMPPAAEGVRTPAYVVLMDRVEANCRVLDTVRRRTGCKILLAQKAFSLPAAYPAIAKHLDGVCASGVNEARMGFEDFRGEVHTYSPAFTDEVFDEVLRYSDHIVFNSLRQWRHFRRRVASAGHPVSVGLRVNPGYSEVKVAMYDPCRPGSRFGVSRAELEGADLEGVEGLHFHALCEQGAGVLARVLESFERNFGDIVELIGAKWVNFGGGHHITKPGYDLALLSETIDKFQRRHPRAQVYLEPGEAVVYDAGLFVASVVDIVENGVQIAILDASAETHTPDVLAMPYRPEIIGAGAAGEKAHTYRLGGCSCLAGDFFGEYSFDEPLKIGDRVIFTDMALYSFVKNTTFNGVELPSIYTHSEAAGLKLVRKFGYGDFRGRLS
jgi:carboxynorspermidine decarboxylase